MATTEELRIKYESFTALMQEVEKYDLNTYDNVMLALYDDEVEPFHRAILAGEKETRDFILNN